MAELLDNRPGHRIDGLPPERIEGVEGWGMSSAAPGYVYRPVNADHLCRVLDLSRKSGTPVGLRGAGRSYGDAAINSDGITLDLTRMNRILDWNPETGRLVAEPGVTIEQVWKYTIEDGWWPPVVSGTMFPTLGGALGMNIHGKNNFRVGPIGDHVAEIDLMLPSGEIVTCSREAHPDLFHAAIGGFGMLGVIVKVTLTMKRVYSGLLNVHAFAAADFDELFAKFEEHLPESDYLVGWTDCFASGRSLGRSLIHRADYLKPGDDPAPSQSLRVANQELPDSIMGIFPKSLMWRVMRPFVNDGGTRAINAAKYLSASRAESKYTQSHAGFAFLLDYVPNWKFVYRPGGLIQYQSFIPAAEAPRVFAQQITLAQKYGIVPYLGVFKRHRPDSFLMSHAVDGYSFALDFAVTTQNRGGLHSLAGEMNRLVIDSGGRFYFAKDSTLHGVAVRESLGADRIGKFCDLKRRCDPESLLQTNLYRRLFSA